MRGKSSRLQKRVRGGDGAAVPAATQDRGLGNEIYDGAAEFGRIMALVSMIGAVLLGFGLIAFGIYMLYRPNLRTAQGKMKATSATCSMDRRLLRCTVIGTLEAADGKTYTVTVNTVGVAVQKDQLLAVNYDPANPLDVSYGKEVSNVLIGWVCIGVGVFVLAGGIFWYWITQRYKFAAAAQGVASGADLFSGSSNTGSSWGPGPGPGPTSYSF